MTNFKNSNIHRGKLIFVFFLFFSYCLYDCSSSGSTDVASEKQKFPQEKNTVKVEILKRTKFPKSLLSNGRIKAVAKSDLKFNISGTLLEIQTGNGDHVTTGQIIAKLDQHEYLQKVNKAEMSYNKAVLELQDILVGQGYDLSDSTDIPEKIYQTASLRSGFSLAKEELKEAKYQLKSTVLRAPFAGIIANLKHKKHEMVNSSEVFCTVIDDSKFEVEFSLIESEIKDVGLKDPVKITPISISKHFDGIVSEINPVIDEYGQMAVKATINNTGGLIQGMNVKVIIEKEIPDQLVVPKSAVLLRQNQEVLFKYVNGIAFWTYIQTGLENNDSYTVQVHPDKGGSLEPGDTIIVSGNLNLAHESAVVIE